MHWGTFNLAIHDWDEPAERLVELAPARDIQLVMPKLGEALEPAHVERVDPWWRAIGALEMAAPEARDKALLTAAHPEDPTD